MHLAIGRMGWVIDNHVFEFGVLPSELIGQIAAKPRSAHPPLQPGHRHEFVVGGPLGA